MHQHFQAKSRGAGKRERTRSALIDGAISVIAEKGMSNANIRDITQVAGLATGTFYNHFEDKESLIATTTLSVATEIVNKIQSEMEDRSDPIERVTFATTRFITIAVNEPDWGAVIVDSNVRLLTELRTDAQTPLADDIQLGVERGYFDVDVSQFLLDQISALILNSIYIQLTNGADEKLTSMTCKHILRLLGHNIA